MTKEQAAVKVYREWFYTVSDSPHSDFCIARLDVLGFIWNGTEWVAPDKETFVQNVMQSKFLDFKKPIALEYML